MSRERTAHGEAGAAWLARLPALVDACAARWGLVVGRRLPSERNWLAVARRAGGEEVVLKLAPAWEEGLRTEAAALSLFEGRGAVELLDAAPELDAPLDGSGATRRPGTGREPGALLLEHLRPGVALEALVLAGEDAAATRIAARAMQRLWRPAPADGGPIAWRSASAARTLPTVSDWGEGFARHRRAHGGGSGPLDEAVLERAEAVFRRLASSQAPPVVLHGDLHHGNLLSASRESWLAIDPKGVVGEPAYEPGALLRNPFPRLLELPDVRRLTARRLDVLAGALGLDRERLRAWAFAQAVLSAVWHVEDGDDGAGRRFAMGCATLLEHA